MEAGVAGWASGPLECVEGGDGVDVADGADAAIAGEYLVAEVAGVGAETPLMDAVVGTEGAAAFGEDFEFAPTAEGQAVGAWGRAWRVVRPPGRVRVGSMALLVGLGLQNC